MIEGNDEPARKKLHDQWTHVNQQIAQTETNIYNLLQSPDSNLDSTIKAQQEEVLRQQQVLVDQRASMDRRLAVAIGVSPAKKKAKGFYPDKVPDTPPDIIPPPPSTAPPAGGTVYCGFSQDNVAAVTAMRERIRIVYSDLVGYQTSDIRLLWTIITRP